MHRVVCELLADADLAGARFSLCEEFTDPPAHLNWGGSATIGWYLRIRNGLIETGAGVIEADRQILMDYATVLPFARTVIDATNRDAVHAELQRAAAEDRFFRVRDAALPTALEPLQHLHNALVAITR